MNRKASDIQARLNRLCQNYARQLPDKVSVIEKAWRDLRADWDEGKHRELIRLCHTLAGSGASYGFERVTKHSRILEQLLQQSNNPVPIDPVIIEKIEDAILQLKTIAKQAPDRPLEKPVHDNPG